MLDLRQREFQIAGSMLQEQDRCCDRCSRAPAAYRIKLDFRRRIHPGRALPRWPTEETSMTKQIESSPLLSLGAGVLVLMKPKLLNYIVAAYLISDGLLRLLARRN
jgi:hypothetical protein